MMRKDRRALRSDAAIRRVRLFAAVASHYTFCGGAKGPVILPAFKAGDSALREPSGGFDSHTLPP
jgi:hypothetical protein